MGEEGRKGGGLLEDWRMFFIRHYMIDLLCGIWTTQRVVDAAAQYVTHSKNEFTYHIVQLRQVSLSVRDSVDGGSETTVQ